MKFTIGLNVAGFGPCPDCNVERMLRVAHDVEDGGGSWCPRCKGSWRIEGSEIVEAPTAAHDLARVPVRVIYQGLLFPDATTTWIASCEGLGQEDLQRMLASMQHLAYGTRRHAQHLRGYDRWTFWRAPSGDFWARHCDTDRELVPYVARPPRTPGRLWPCQCCKRPIEPRTTGYKIVPSATHRNWDVAWKLVRICARCAEGAPLAGVREPLRAIDRVHEAKGATA